MTDLGYRASDYNSFVLYTGYAESTPLTALVFSYQGEPTELKLTKYEAWAESFKSLSCAIKQYAEHEFGCKTCCKKSPKGANYCSVCGKFLSGMESNNDDIHDTIISALELLWSCENHQTPAELDCTNEWSLIDHDPLCLPILRSYILYRAEDFITFFEDDISRLKQHFWNEDIGFWDNVRIEHSLIFPMK